jgi:hypothetical protein
VKLWKISRSLFSLSPLALVFWKIYETSQNFEVSKGNVWTRKIFELLPSLLLPRTLSTEAVREKFESRFSLSSFQVSGRNVFVFAMNLSYKLGYCTECTPLGSICDKIQQYFHPNQPANSIIFDQFLINHFQTIFDQF